MYTENVDGKFEFVHTSLGPPRKVVNVQGNAKEFLTLLFFSIAQREYLIRFDE